MAEFTRRVIMLYAEKMEFNGKDGKPVQNLTVTYTNGAELKATVDSTGRKRGVSTATKSIPFSCCDKIVDVPGFYDLYFDVFTNRKGNDEIGISDIRFVSPLPPFATVPVNKKDS